MTVKLEWKRIGFLQLSILALVWNKEMYGLEIGNHLSLQGYPVKTSQLYPALNNLEANGYLEKKESTRAGVSRNFYKTSSKGHELLTTYLMKQLELFINIAFDSDTLDYLYDYLDDFLQIEEGIVLADFSLRLIEPLLSSIIPKIGLTGHYFIISPSDEMMPILKDRINHYELESVASVLQTDSAHVTALANDSVDIALLVFTLHEEKTEWMLREIRRILKPSGRIIVIDTLDIHGHIVIDLIVSFIPNHQHFGLDRDIFKELLEKNSLKIAKENTINGIGFWELKKDINY